uniref:DB domain-containing protein n=1 Tax=Mesocestoides corti TaxID=53468 RepID=A0A5K3FWW0_MESCO
MCSSPRGQLLGIPSSCSRTQMRGCISMNPQVTLNPLSFPFVTGPSPRLLFLLVSSFPQCNLAHLASCICDYAIRLSLFINGWTQCAISGDPFCLKTCFKSCFHLRYTSSIAFCAFRIAKKA